MLIKKFKRVKLDQDNKTVGGYAREKRFSGEFSLNFFS